MNNRSQSQNGRGKQSWGEIQLAIAAVAITATLVFWNLFSVPQKQQVLAQAADTAMPPPPEPDPTQAPTPTQGFVPVKIIFGGTAPKQQVIVQASAAQPKRKSGGGGGSNGGGTAPKPPVTTGSSKP
jgi:hypothetical protein